MLSLFLFFFFHCSADHRDLHSFPTRRSSDLGGSRGIGAATVAMLTKAGAKVAFNYHKAAVRADKVVEACGRDNAARSEEHTSELQSRRDLVCRLLLEKKKKNTKRIKKERNRV